MASPNKLRELEDQYGDLNKVIPKLVNELGQKGAAKKLGASQSFVSMWLNANHYVLFNEWRKVETQPEASQ